MELEAEKVIQKLVEQIAEQALEIAQLRAAVETLQEQGPADD